MGVTKGDARSLDYSSYGPYQRLLMGGGRTQPKPSKALPHPRCGRCQRGFGHRGFPGLGARGRGCLLYEL